MSKEVRTQPCPECGGVMKYEKHDDLLEYQGQTRTIKTLGWWCRRCGEGILTGEPLLAHEQAFQEFKAEIDHVLGPKEVAQVRRTLGLSQRRAGDTAGRRTARLPEVRGRQASGERADEPSAPPPGQ